jgi:5,10-methenyltetrahydrofolate synthetase
VDKNKRREAHLKKMLSLSSTEMQSLRSGITHQLISFFNTFPALVHQVGGSYLEMSSEVSPEYEKLFKEFSLKLSFPVLVEEKMLFAFPQKAPSGRVWLNPPYELAEPLWLLIPGLGFDLNGTRLGRGKGYYDRYLKDRDVLKIGLSWSELVENKIPLDVHDVQMNFLITEKYCWDINQQKKL